MSIQKYLQLKQLEEELFPRPLNIKRFFLMEFEEPKPIIEKHYPKPLKLVLKSGAEYNLLGVRNIETMKTPSGVVITLEYNEARHKKYKNFGFLLRMVDWDKSEFEPEDFDCDNFRHLINRTKSKPTPKKSKKDELLRGIQMLRETLKEADNDKARTLLRKKIHQYTEELNK